MRSAAVVVRVALRLRAPSAVHACCAALRREVAAAAARCARRTGLSMLAAVSAPKPIGAVYCPVPEALKCARERNGESRLSYGPHEAGYRSKCPLGGCSSAVGIAIRTYAGVFQLPRLGVLGYILCRLEKTCQLPRAFYTL